MLLELLLSLVEPSINNYSAETLDLQFDNDKYQQRLKQYFKNNIASNLIINNQDCNEENVSESENLAMILMQNYSRFLSYNYN